MDQFAALGTVAYKVHMELRNVYFLLLPVSFMISVAIVWFQNPTGWPEFLDKVKRAFIATLLLTAFAEISDAILIVANGIADQIDNMSGIDSIMQMASEKVHSYKASPLSPILAFDDLVIAALSYLSWAILYAARYVMVAIYQFAWVFLSIAAPLLLLFHVFTSQITLKLFTSLAEIASWKIGWAILSVMLKALPFGTWYAVDGSYFTIVVLNFVIALAMVSTPLIIHSLVSGSFTSVVGGIGGVTVATMLGAPAKAISALKIGGREIGLFSDVMRGMNSKLGQDGMSHSFGIDTKPPSTMQGPGLRDSSPAVSSPPPPPTSI